MEVCGNLDGIGSGVDDEIVVGFEVSYVLIEAPFAWVSNIAGIVVDMIDE